MGQSLDELQAEFLAKGGKVQQIQTGVGSAPVTRPVMHNANPTKAQPLTVSAALRAEEDQRLVELIRLAKDEVVGSTQLADQLGVSASRLQRLLSKYFADDPSVDPLRAMSRRERSKRDDAVVLEKVKNLLAKDVKGLYALSAATGASTVRISRLAKSAGITIPRSEGKEVVPVGSLPVPIDTLKRWALEGSQSTYATISRWLENYDVDI